MEFIKNDGGRKNSGHKGQTRDCVCRAISIATEIPYEKVYSDLNSLIEKEFPRTKQSIAGSSRTGVIRFIYQKYLEELGWKWVPTMKFGQGCTVHLRKEELPSGRIICRLSKHLAAVIDGVLYDTYDCSRDGTRCVYGYFTK